MNEEKDKFTGRDDEGVRKIKEKDENTKDIERKQKMNQMKKKIKKTIKSTLSNE